MKERNTSDRLKEIMAKNGLRQIDILNKAIPFCKKYNVKLGRNDLSQYISGKVEPSQKKLTVLAEALEVNEAWLMGYDVPMETEIKRQNNKSRIYFGLTLLELFRYYKIHINNNINFKTFCDLIGIEESRMLDFINYKTSPNREEINRIYNLYNMDSEEKLFDGELYEELIEKNNGSWGIQMIKNSMPEEDYINENNLSLIITSLLPDKIKLDSNSLENTNKNRIILKQLLLDNNLITSGKEINKEDISNIKTFLEDNIDYINNKLNDEERNKITLNHPSSKISGTEKEKLIESKNE
jgi:transcriptional regulator with XRE-family HTH domain